MKLILGTNVMESSITVADATEVIDINATTKLPALLLDYCRTCCFCARVAVEPEVPRTTCRVPETDVLVCCCFEKMMMHIEFGLLSSMVYGGNS